MINLDAMKKLSKLTKIRLPENEVDAFISKLQNVMDMINTLKEVDAEGVEPLTSAVRSKLHLRKDEVTDGDIVDDLFANVPGSSAALAREIKCYVVPKVVE